MRQKLSRYILQATAAALIMGSTACKKDYLPTSSAPSESVLTSAKGLTSVAIGLQEWYSYARTSLVYTRVTASGILTGELNVVNAGNTDEYLLQTGGNTIPNTNAISTGIWTVANKVIYDANNVINNIGSYATPGYASGLIGYASIFKALAIGDLAMFFDHVPDTVGNNVNFITSQQGFTKAVAVIDKALAGIAANPISSSLTSSIPAGIDIQNTLYALKARYSLMAGDNASALAAANNVSLTVKSVFNYSSAYTSPIYTTSTATNNVYQPVDSTMGLPLAIAPDLSDKREPFYIKISANPRYRINGFDSATTAARPVYLPGEITLIKAEAYTRLDDLPNGLAQLNTVVTKQPSADPYGVGAGLTGYGTLSKDDQLTQIYRNRCIELFMSGLKLTDEKRFGRPTSERKRSWLPFPYVERNANTNTPDDPAF